MDHRNHAVLQELFLKEDVAGKNPRVDPLVPPLTISTEEVQPPLQTPAIHLLDTCSHLFYRGRSM